MGWSCTKAAGDVQRKWSEYCRKETGLSNTFWDGRKVFFETDYIEYDDGRITGQIIAMNGDRLGEFQINGDGTIAKAPKVLKDLTEGEK